MVIHADEAAGQDSHPCVVRDDEGDGDAAHSFDVRAKRLLLHAVASAVARWSSATMRQSPGTNTSSADGLIRYSSGASSVRTSPSHATGM